MSAVATAPSVPLVGHDVLRGLYAHRLMSTSQLWELYAPELTRRWMLKTLTNLEARDMVARVRIAGIRTREFAWYLRPDGLAVTEGPGVEVRPYRMDARRASGPLQAHTLAANEVGLCFVRAARSHGDDCWSDAWRNETAHRIGAGGSGEVVISDAILDYTVVERTGSTYLVRFVEIDRATTSARTLIRKLEAYARLCAYPPAWRAYPVFPPIMVVMAGPPEAVLERRIDALHHMLPLSAPIANAGIVISVVTLEQLRTHGPHAPIFWQLGAEVLVDVRGRTTRR